MKLPLDQNCQNIIGNNITLDFYEHLLLQQCQAITMKSEHSRKHQITFARCFNISHVFKECDFSNVTKMNIFTTANRKSPTSTRWKDKLSVYTFFCWKCDGNWSITETCFCFKRVLFVSTELNFCFNRARRKKKKNKQFILIIDQTYSPKTWIIVLEVMHKGKGRAGSPGSGQHEPAGMGLNPMLGLVCIT